jgi:para-aminobenzoate synthetase/4-amino-4-deoxychorismate lyase
MPENLVLYEALLWEPSRGYFLLERHLQRLESSARHFDYPLDIETVRSQLSEFAAGLGDRPRKVRLEAFAAGHVALMDEDVKPSTPVTLALARKPVDSSDVFLRHKTSRRQVYSEALAEQPHAQDVLLWNERRELTESCSANLVLEIDGEHLTPPVACGLLAGTFRAQLLAKGEVQERVLPLDCLERAAKLFLINSVRRRWEGRLVGRGG